MADSPDDPFWYRDARAFFERFERCQWNIVLLADTHGIGTSTATRWMRRHGIKRPDWVGNGKGNTIDNPSQPPLDVPVYDEQLVISGDPACSSDWHAPLIHRDTFNRMLDDLATNETVDGIVAGDITNQDALAGHDEQHADADMEAEQEMLHWAVDQYLDAITGTLYISRGNHDRHHQIKAKVKFERSMRMLLSELSDEKKKRIVITGRDSVHVNTERGLWIICHTRNYSAQPLAYPNKLALRHNAHIAAGHRHHLAHGLAANGKDMVELGGLMWWENMPYVTRYTNHLPMMQRGWGRLKDGRMIIPMLIG